MVGVQVAREAARELHPKRIVISALTRREVDEAVSLLSKETKGIDYVPAAADIFLPESLQGKDRGSIIANRDDFEALFAESFSPDADHRASAFFKLIERHKRSE